MKVQFDRDDLRPLVELCVAEALDRLEAERFKLNGRLAYTEPEAAALLGVRPHVLRDCRLRGEISASRCGSKIVYSRGALLKFLEQQRLD